MNEGIFPNERAIKERNDAIEEERRLFYVAITRAKEKLYISSTNSMSMYGRTSIYRPSTFVEEIMNFIDDKTMKFEFNFDQDKVSTSRIRNDAYSYSRVYVSNDDINRTKLNHQLNNYNKKEKIANSNTFKVGEKIKHEKYGIGTVVKFEQSSGKIMLMVAFDGEGIKLFDLKKEKRITRA